jgi:hypothetical protein
MFGSGENTLSTSGDTPITLIAANAGLYGSVTIYNESGIAGAFSLDGGASFQRWPPTVHSLCIGAVISNKAVMFKRVASGTDVTGLSAFLSQ